MKKVASKNGEKSVINKELYVQNAGWVFGLL